MAVSMGVVVGLIKALGANPEAITQAVNDWLDDHPEATTTVEDGSITYAKLATALAAILDGKIDEPSQDGTNGQVLTTDGNGGRTWQTIGLSTLVVNYLIYILRHATYTVAGI